MDSFFATRLRDEFRFLDGARVRDERRLEEDFFADFFVVEGMRICFVESPNKTPEWARVICEEFRFVYCLFLLCCFALMTREHQRQTSTEHTFERQNLNTEKRCFF